MNDQTDADLVNLREMRAQLRVNHRTLKKLIESAGVELYRSPIDRRVILVNRADVARLAAPQPMNRPAEGAAMSPTAA